MSGREINLKGAEESPDERERERFKKDKQSDPRTESEVIKRQSKANEIRSKESSAQLCAIKSRGTTRVKKYRSKPPRRRRARER